MDGRPPLFSPDALDRNALNYQRTLLEAGAPAIRQVVSPAAPDVTYPAFLEPLVVGESRTELILIITCVIIMVIAVVDAIIALIVGLISDIVQLATGPPGFLSSASASSGSTPRCGCRARSRCSRTRSTPAASAA